MAKQARGKGKSKGKSKGRSQRRALDAFQLAEKAEQYSKGQKGASYSDDESDDGGAILNARKHLGEEYQGDDEEFEDEEIDSDEALGSDEDFEVLDSKISQTIRDRKKANKKIYEQDLDEDEENLEYDNIDSNQLFSLSDVWAMDDEDLKKTKEKASKSDKKAELVLDDNFVETASESEEDSEEDSEEMSGSEEEDSDDEEEDEEEDSDIDEEAETNFDNVLSRLKSGLPKRSKIKKSLINDKNEESEFGLPTTGESMSIMDMMADLEEDENPLLLKNTNKSELKPLSVPLPQSIQKKHDRGAAYEISKNEVAKWEETVQANRRADVLKFNSVHASELHNAASSFTPVDTPMTELEKKVADVVKDSEVENKMTESLFEEIAVAKMSKEEMMKRTNELRLMRELMYRGQKDSKRLKKIKSKTYRQKLRKERLRNKELVEEGSDFEGSSDDGEDEDLKRARERMTLKHKNTSKWAKSMIKSGMSKDKSNREEMEEMLREGEKLRRKQLGHGSDEEENDDRRLSDVENDQNYSDNEEAQNTRSKLGKGLMAMDFMKNAEERQRLDNKREIEELRAYSENASRADQDSMFGEGSTTSVNVNMNAGRRIYTPGAAAAAQKIQHVNHKVLQEVEDDEAKSLSNRLSGKKKQSKSPTSSKQSNEDNSNPWLDNDDDEGSGHRSKKISVIDESSSRLAKSGAKIEKHNSKKKRGSDNATADDDVEISIGETLDIVQPQTNKKRKVVSASSANQENEYEDEAEGEDDIRMFKNKDLVKEAFAGDDVVNEFIQEKKEVEVEEDDKQVDLTLPGWGEWSGGNDNKKKPKKKIVKTINGVVAKNNRKDKNMKNVIINEKVNKKNIKYQATAIPYPFETMEQYQRSLRMPIGQEWTSKATHQKLTMPKVVSKHGSVIGPLKGPNK